MNNNSNFDQEKILSMMEAATLSLTWEPVAIFLRAPIFKKAEGEAYRGASGRLEINIIPNLDLEKFYETWLHECGHVFLGHCSEMAPRIMSPELEKNYLEGGALFELSIDQWKFHDESDPDELDARGFASEIDHYAQGEAMRLYGNKEVESRLRVLMNTILKR